MTVSHIRGGRQTPRTVSRQLTRDNIILKTGTFTVRAVQLDHGTPVMAYKIEVLPVMNIEKKYSGAWGWPRGPGWAGSNRLLTQTALIPGFCFPTADAFPQETWPRH